MIHMDVANFAAERMVMGQKVEAALLKVSANNQGHWIRGDVKINGVPAALDYRKPRDGDADIRVQATLDENARSKFGFDLGGFLTGPVPIKLSGRVPAHDGDSRFAVDADLTQAKVDNLLPGWSKAPGRSGRATFTLVSKAAVTPVRGLGHRSARRLRSKARSRSTPAARSCRRISPSSAFRTATRPRSRPIAAPTARCA